MLLKIRHVSHYHYDRPVTFAVQRLHLWPKDTPGQKVIDWQLDVEGALIEATYVDGFGNRTDLLRHERNANSLRIVAGGTVETVEKAGVLGPVYGYAPLWLFERRTPLTRPGEAVAALVASVADQGDPLDRMHLLMSAIHQRVAYSPGTTDTTTEAEAALAAGSGVCQDHAHIFIAAARMMGLPARYVSGYLMMGERSQTATHAWAEAHVDGLGWVGFDAANDICPDERYVRIACGLDYRDAAPVIGLRYGPGDETLAVALDVEQ
jgi:transglutaminase-like putative cysteine protease